MTTETTSKSTPKTTSDQSTQQSAVSIQPMDIDSNPAEKKTVSGREILSAIREMAERLGRYPSMPELTQAYPAIKMGTVRKYFAGYGDALREAGFEGGGCGYTVTMEALFRDWARLARKYQRCPTMSEYERESKYSVRPLVGRFRVWSQVPRGLYGYAEEKELDVEYADVMAMIREHYGEQLATSNWQLAKPKPTTEARRHGEEQNLTADYADCVDKAESGFLTAEARRRGEESGEFEGQEPNRPSKRSLFENPPVDFRHTQVRLDPRRWEAREMRQRKAPILPDRPIFGPPMVDTALACGPTNENGVIYLFGSLARELGFVVMRIQTEFPDCLALRYIGDDRWQLIRIEFEYQSRNFLKHMHDAKKCDLIVCWEHNWKECPIEVIELREIIKGIGWAM